MTLQEKQDALVNEINGLGDCFDQYSYLIFRAGNLPGLPEEKKTEDNLIRGCQSIVWAEIRVTDDRIQYQADSETLIIKGILAIIADLVDGTPVEEICTTPIDILDRTELAVTFESERMAGIQSILRQIKEIALSYRHF